MRDNFSCGVTELDRWFTRDALRDRERGTILGTCAFLPERQRAAAFYAVASVAEEARKLPGVYHLFGGGQCFPCLQLVYLGVQRELQHQGIGSALAGAVITLFAEIGPKIGLPHLILVPIDDDVKAFYSELGFEPYDGGTRMFLPLQTALQAVAEVRGAL